MNERPSRSWITEWIPDDVPDVETVALMLVVFAASYATASVAAGSSISEQVWLVWVLFPAVLALSVPAIEPQHESK